MKELKHEDYYNGTVLGFLFSEDLQHVVLTRDYDNDGKLNGITGPIFHGGSHISAIISHCKDKTDIDLRMWQCRYVKSIELKKDHCHIFALIGDISELVRTNDVWVCSIKKLNRKTWKPVKISSKMASYLVGEPTDAFELKLTKGLSKLVEECRLNILKT